MLSLVDHLPALALYVKDKQKGSIDLIKPVATEQTVPFPEMLIYYFTH